VIADHALTAGLLAAASRPSPAAARFARLVCCWSRPFPGTPIHVNLGTVQTRAGSCSKPRRMATGNRAWTADALAGNSATFDGTLNDFEATHVIALRGYAYLDPAGVCRVLGQVAEMCVTTPPFSIGVEPTRLPRPSDRRPRHPIFVESAPQWAAASCWNGPNSADEEYYFLTAMSHEGGEVLSVDPPAPKLGKNTTTFWVSGNAAQVTGGADFAASLQRRRLAAPRQPSP